MHSEYADRYRSNPDVARITDDFHRLVYPTAWTTKYLGIPTIKSPLDLWVYQEILFDVRPDLVIECGTWKGGTTLYLAHLMDAIGHGRILSIDMLSPFERGLPHHKRIGYLMGDSLQQNIVPGQGERVLVILDSDHSASHVARELVLYSPLVTVGSYLIVEDTDIHGHPIDNPDLPGDPMRAVVEFMSGYGKENFEIDRSREKYFVSQNPCGYLKRIAESKLKGTIKRDE